MKKRRDAMDYNKYRFNGEKKYRNNSIKTNEVHGVKDKAEGEMLLKKNIVKIDEWVDKLSADGSKGLVIVIQAMDAAGKDGTIRHVFSGVNPAGMHVVSFKQPSSVDLAHDYLWRIHKSIGERGQITVLNRSHYEDVLIGKVLDLPKHQNLPKAALKNIWKNRYREIVNFEEYLSENGYTVIKIHLHLGKEEQRKRLLARIDTPEKNRKYSHGDIETRGLWDTYMKAYADCINNTATDTAPWFVVPADRKWYARYVISEIVLDTLRKMRPAYPHLGEEDAQHMEADRALLVAEAEDKISEE